MKSFFKNLLVGLIYFFFTYSPIVVLGFILVSTFVFKFGAIYEFLFADGSLFDFIQCIVFIGIYLFSLYFIRNEYYSF